MSSQTAAPVSPDPLLIGSSWYPEMWPESQWAHDLQKMNDLGLTIVRVFEFAWHKLEPKMARYDFSWALRCLDLCHKHNIRVMIGTPTAAPPAWLSYGFPDILRTHIDGTRDSHGGRKHYSVFSKRYRDFTSLIVTQMAKTFASHPALHSWQIDNEMGSSDYGQEALDSFHQYLKDKFQTIDALNAAWGLEFWSQAYQSFEQVPMPQAATGSIETPERHHPSLVLAVAKHNNDAWSSFIKLQADIIREHSNKPITTNMTPGLGMHWYQHNRHLDRVGFSMYRDVDHYHWNLMNFDRMRAEKQNPQEPRAPYTPYYLLETAPSWSAGGKWWNIHHDGKGITNISWLSTLLGGSMTLYWQFRSHWAGQEMQHGTLLDATGNFSVNREAITQICKDHKVHEPFLQQHPPQRAQTAIVLSHESAWAFSIDPIDDNMVYANHWRDAYYLPLAQAHYWRDVISEDHDLSAYKLLILPLMPMIKKSTRQKLDEWVRNGGHLLLGPIVGHRTDEFTQPTSRALDGLEDLIGTASTLRFTTHWQNKTVHLSFAPGSPFTSPDAPPAYRNQSEAFAPLPHVQTLATYTHGYAHNQPAILLHPLGKGRVLTLGTALSPEHYLQAIHALAAPLEIHPLATGSPHIALAPRADASNTLRALGLVNLAESPQSITLRQGPTLTLDPLEWRLHTLDTPSAS